MKTYFRFSLYEKLFKILKLVECHFQYSVYIHFVGKTYKKLNFINFRPNIWMGPTTRICEK